MKRRTFACLGTAAVAVASVYAYPASDVQAESVLIEGIVFETADEGYIHVPLIDYARAYGQDTPLTAFLSNQNASISGVYLNDKLIDLIDFATAYDSMTSSEIYENVPETTIDQIREIIDFEADGSPVFSDRTDEAPPEDDDTDFGVIDIY